MTDVPYDPEHHAEDTANKVFVRHMVKISAKMLLITLVGIVLAAVLRVFAVIALWHVPAWAFGFLLSIIIADWAWFVVSAVRNVRKRRQTKAERAHLTQGQRAEIEMDDLATARAEMERMNQLRNRVRKPKWWLRRALDVVYTACLGLVYAHWYDSVTVGVSVAVGFAAFAMITGQWGMRRMPGMMSIGGFIDPRAPRDSPEI